MRFSFVQIDLNADDIFSSFSVLFVAHKREHNFLNGGEQQNLNLQMKSEYFSPFLLSSQIGKKMFKYDYVDWKIRIRHGSDALLLAIIRFTH